MSPSARPLGFDGELAEKALGSASTIEQRGVIFRYKQAGKGWLGDEEIRPLKNVLKNPGSLYQ
ncbi:MAG: hypothetical protein HQ469_10020 [Cyanobacteria bacterium]|nr:hypothetical protein [Cyanobacteria bacterium bin.275]